MCESQASLNTQRDMSAASDDEYIIHKKNLTDQEAASTLWRVDRLNACGTSEALMKGMHNNQALNS